MKGYNKILLVFTILLMFTISFPNVVNATTYFVTGEGVRVRSTAENRPDNIIGRLSYGAQLDVVNASGSWYLIRYGSGYGYVTRTFISSYENVVSTSTIALTRSATDMKTSNGAFICRISKDAVVKVGVSNSSSTCVQYNGQIGYVKTSNLKKITNANENCLGSYTISYTINNSARKKNITKAANAINKCIVQPGQSFSFINKIGTSGYSYAPEFIGNSSILGGGLSQVSTSLYQCIRDAQRNNCNINVTVQNRFSALTPYAKLGEEAMVDVNSRTDLCFINYNNYPIRIYSMVNGNNVSFVISAVK